LLGAGLLGAGLLGAGLLGAGLLGADGAGVDGAGAEGVLSFVEGAGLELLVEGAEPLVDSDFAGFFLAGFFFASALRDGSVPPTSTPATAGGAATLIVSAFAPAPALAVLPPLELEMPNAAANAATTAMRPMAIERVSMSGALLSRAPSAMVRFCSQDV
jgi:hypothetical protein